MNPSLRAAVVAEWRGLPEKKVRADRWQSPAGLMPKLMQRLGLRERLRETEVIEAWSRIVGDFIAAQLRKAARLISRSEYLVLQQRLFEVRDGIVTLMGEYRAEWRRRFGTDSFQR
jgi:hypothetical protein